MKYYLLILILCILISTTYSMVDLRDPYATIYQSHARTHNGIIDGHIRLYGKPPEFMQRMPERDPYDFRSYDEKKRLGILI